MADKKQKVIVLDNPPKKKKERSLTVRGKQDLSVESLIARAIDKGTPVETMERILAMAEKVKAGKAKEAFDMAMAKFQSECPIIKKTKQVLNKDKQSVRYLYAPLDSIVSQTRKPISKYGLSYTINTKQDEKSIKAIVTIVHTAGHSQSSEFSVPIDNDSYMSQPQRFAAALTFAKRYAFCNAFGIMTGDEDNDATPQKSEPKKPEPKKPVTMAETQTMIRNAIKQAKTAGDAIDIDKQTQKSTKFSKTFKAEVKKLANQKVDELNK